MWPQVVLLVIQIISMVLVLIGVGISIQKNEGVFTYITSLIVSLFGIWLLWEGGWYNVFFR